jgi:hypothetical protein
MCEHKRACYIWLFVILASMCTYVLLVGLAVFYNGAFGSEAYTAPFQDDGGGIALIVFPLILSGVSAIISRNHSLREQVIWHGLFIASVLTYGVWNAQTCKELHCGMYNIFLVIYAGPPIALFFLILGLLRTSSIKLLLSVLCIEVLFVLGGAYGIVSKSHANALLDDKVNLIDTLLNKQGIQTTDFAEIGRACDDLPNESAHDFLTDNCWKKVAFRFPNTEVCTWSREEHSRNVCLYGIQDEYSYIDDIHACEDGSIEDASTTGEGYTIHDTELIACWKAVANMYPNKAVCDATYDENYEKCVRALGDKTLDYPESGNNP